MEPSIDTRDAPCPRCGYLLWFSDDLTSRYPDLADKWSVAKKRVLHYATKRFGPPNDAVRADLDRIESSKFEKVEWIRLHRAKNWPEVIAMIKTSGRQA